MNSSNGNKETLDRQVCMWVDEATVDAAARAAKRQERSLSWYMRNALRQQLQRDGFQTPNSGVAA